MSMEITLKPLKGDTFTVQANPEDKIADLKKKIAEVRSEFPVESQKLIYSGKILNDDATVQDSGVSSTGFVVVMVTKAKPPDAAAPAAAAAAPAAAPAATPAAAPNPAASAAATMMTGPDMEASITQLCAMGFERPEVERCLQAAFGNPDRAVEYLMSGIPEGILPPAGGAPPAAGGAAAAPGAGGGGMAPGAFPAMPGPGAGPRAPLPPALAQLRENPQFAQLAAMVAQNPQMLEQMLPALQQSNPEIMQAIQSNPQAFMEMLAEAGGGGGGAAQDPVSAMLAAAGGGGGGGAGAAGRAGQMAQLAAALQANPAMLQQILPEILPEIEAQDPAQAQAIRENPQLLLQVLQQAGAMGMGGGMPGGGGGGGVIRLTEEENAAVGRLVEMGFDRNAAAQAYLACDKNEELAANFLFDNAGQD